MVRQLKSIGIIALKDSLKELEGIPKKELQKILKKIKVLSSNSKPQGSQKLSHREQYRFRQGDYRIIYSIHDDNLTVHIIGSSGKFVGKMNYSSASYGVSTTVIPEVC